MRFIMKAGGRRAILSAFHVARSKSPAFPEYTCHSQAMSSVQVLLLRNPLKLSNKIREYSLINKYKQRVVIIFTFLKSESS